MKKIFTYYIAITATLMMFFASCDDFLTNPPADRLTSDGFYQTPKQSEQGVIGIYAILRDISRDEFMYMSEFRSDNIWVRLPDGYRETSEVSNFRAGPDLNYFNSTWNNWYKVIYDSNVALEKIEACDFGTNEVFKKQLLGEVYFLRGWAYFELARLFGNIPIIDKPMSPSEVLNVSQSPAREVYDKIILPDMLKAKEILPLDVNMLNSTGKKTPGSGRADKVAAQAMLGRIYMTMAGFPMNDAQAKTQAKTELKAVIDYSEANANKFWAPDSVEWRKQWMSEYNNKYSIFAIQYRSGGTGNPAIFETGAKCPPTYTGFQVYNELDVWVEKSMVNEYLKIHSNGKRDARGLGHSILLGYNAEPNWPARMPQYDVLYPGSTVQVPTNTMFYKYLNTKPKRASLGITANIESGMKDYRDWPVNYPVLRYEDVLLMYAELLAGEGNSSGAVEIVNRIRKRAGCDEVTATSTAEALNLIKKERRLELFGEGVRWFDLVRWNEWQQTIINMFHAYSNPPGSEDANVKDGRYLYPIPMNQINVKPGLYQQNTGY